jgi:biotin transport system substrate-specific component
MINIYNFRRLAMIKTLRLPAYTVLLFTLLQVIGASLFIALCSQIEIHLFFTPVPLTLQTFAVMLVGVFLGPKMGVASVMTYLAEGCMGLPVFSGGNAGFLWFFGHTGGYLFGFIIQAYITSMYLQKSTLSSSAKTLSVLFFSCVAQLGLGVLWLGHIVGWKHVLLMGFYPYLPGEMFKCLCVTKVLKRT